MGQDGIMVIWCTLYNAHCTTYTVQYILYNGNCTMQFNIDYAMCTVHLHVGNMYCCNIHSKTLYALYTVQLYMLYSVHCTPLYTVHCKAICIKPLYIVQHCTLYKPTHYTLYNCMHCTLYNCTYCILYNTIPILHRCTKCRVYYIKRYCVTTKKEPG